MNMMTNAFEKLIDFTRTSAGGYYGPDGLFRMTPASKNLLTYTQEFDNAAWTKTAATVTANALSAPDGTLTADALVATAGASLHRVLGNGAVAGVQQVFSLYAKAGTHRYLQVNSGADAQLYANFDLLTGTVGNVGTIATAFIESVGNGWYRCGFIGTPATTAGMRATLITSATAAFDESWTATGTESLYLWGAQLEANTAATSYARNFGGLFPPRFDYDPVTKAPRGLLVEEQRTNLLLRSEEFESASWFKSRATVTANAAVSPDGTADADKIVEDTTASTTQSISQSASFSSGTSYTYSIYVKAGERNWIALQFSSSVVGGGTAPTAYFNVSSGAVGTTIGPVTAAIMPAGNGWFRCSLTLTATASVTSTIVAYLSPSDGGAVYTGDGTSGIYLWGAQLEAGAFPTSYIPTTASQVTRTADIATITGANFSNWYSQTEGTFVVEYSTPAATVSSANKSLTSANDGSGNNRIYGCVAASGAPTFLVLNAGVTEGSVVNAIITNNAVTSSAWAYKVNDFGLSTDGGVVATDTTGTPPGALNKLDVGNHLAGQQLNGHIRSIKYYPTRLGNAQLQTLSA